MQNLGGYAQHSSGSELAVSIVDIKTRQYTDLAFGATYVILLLTTIIIGGIKAGAVMANAAATKACTPPGVEEAAAQIASAAADSRFAIDIIGTFNYSAIPIFVSIFVGTVWMALLRFFAKPVVYATLIIKGVVIIGIGYYLSYGGFDLFNPCAESGAIMKFSYSDLGAPTWPFYLSLVIGSLCTRCAATSYACATGATHAC